MAYSYSAMKTFSNCPRRYYEEKVIKIHPHKDTESTLYGKDVHEACELYIRDDKPLGGHSRFQAILDSLKSIKGDKHCEMELAVCKDGKAVAFDDENAKFRGIADLVILDGARAYVFDYKTGSDKYPDTAQLELMALFLMAKYPEINEVKAALLFILHGTVIKATYHKRDELNMWKLWHKKVTTIQAVTESGVWPERSSGLCPWCPCTTCPSWKPRRT
jgi:CRISPR/Cas system-associated exonuclease Cas4 (RecB family)